MGKSKIIPANATVTSNIYHDGDKPLFNGNVYKGMPFEEILCVIEKIMDLAFSETGYDCIDLKKLGIECVDEKADKKCIILNWLVDNMVVANENIKNIITLINTIQTTVGLLKDEKTKVTAAGTSKYLAQSIITAPGASDVTNETITILGTVPIGFRATINANRIADFDNTGKGKVGTDLWGWAIGNGANGTVNRVGLFTQYEENPSLLDTESGTNEFVVSKENIKTMSFSVSGVINETLENNVQFEFDATNNVNGGPRPNGFASNHSGSVSTYKTKPYNFKHSHNFTLSANHTNPNVTPIALIPKHLKEIPIERIIP